MSLATIVTGIVAQVPPGLGGQEGQPVPTAPTQFTGPSVDWFAVLPVLVLVAGALVVLVGSALFPKALRAQVNTFITVLASGGALVAGVLLWDDVRDEGPRLVLADAVTVDGFAVFFTILITASIVLAALLADDYLRREDLPDAELHGLLMLSGAGGIIMAGANDLIVLFLGLEVLSIALYVLAGFHLRRSQSQEAAVKYFVLGAFSSAFLLYGIALVYGATGTTNLFEISSYLATTTLLSNGLLLAGMALLLVGLGFKVAAVPFHQWTPDVYQGSPTPVTGFMAAVAKAAGFAGLLRVFHSGFGLYVDDWTPAIWLLAVATLVVGSVMAIVQTDVKRMLAYSSISHAGFVLVGMEAGTARGVAGSLFYLFVYAFMVLGSFAVLTLISRTGDASTSLDDHRGLARQRPFLAFAFAVFLLAQAGMPLTSGFLAKLEVISAAVDAESYGLAVIAMLSAAVAAFLYLRIMVAMYLTEPEGEPAPVRLPFTAGVTITTALLFTVVVGIVPDGIVELAHDATLLIGTAPLP